MKVPAIDSSARKDGNTAVLIWTVFEELGLANMRNLGENMAFLLNVM